MSDVPVNVPVDTVKLRIEKTMVRRIPTEAFYYLVDLRYLWITYNSISSVDTASFYNLKVLHELRLDGNMISVFPWESLKEMPRLKTLDLHNNRITNVPNEAIPFLLNITYLDLSSNKLTTLPSDLMDIWPPFNGAPMSHNVSQKVVLGKGTKVGSRLVQASRGSIWFDCNYLRNFFPSRVRPSSRAQTRPGRKHHNIIKSAYSK